MTDRICQHGHRVTDPDAERCPLCGVDLASSRPAGGPAAVRRTSPDTGGSPGPVRSWNFIVSGLVLIAVGTVVAYSWHSDPPVVLGLILSSIGTTAVLIGAVGIGVYNGMLDFTDRKRADRSRRDPE
jgi:hypothetical protein